jgi:hypothetical protein
MARRRKVIDMLTARFYRTFRERYPEFIMTAVQLCWGINAWTDALNTDVPRHIFDGPFYGPLQQIMPQMQWGVYATSIGFVRACCLIINGSRPRGSATLRAFGAWLSTIFWLGLLYGALRLPWNSNAVYSYGGLLAFDIFALFFAAKDARSAFDNAREAKVHGYN